MASIDIARLRANALLNTLPDEPLVALCAVIQETDLPLGTELYRPAEPLTAVYFPLSGVVSLLNDLDGDQSVEAATVGNEGMCGLAVFLGAGTSTERAVVQVPGHALTVSVDDFQARAGAPQTPLHQSMRRYTQLMLTQLARNAACHCVHPVRQRAARWLLATADRMDTPRFELTQQFFAQMLNVRRATVNEVAQDLAADGCISYSRGLISIVDRLGLQAHACTCYQVLRHATLEALPPAFAGTPVTALTNVL